MPGFPSLHRDDEIWAVIAFLRKRCFQATALTCCGA